MSCRGARRLDAASGGDIERAHGPERRPHEHEFRVRVRDWIAAHAPRSDERR